MRSRRLIGCVASPCRALASGVTVPSRDSDLPLDALEVLRGD